MEMGDREKKGNEREIIKKQRGRAVGVRDKEQSKEIMGTEIDGFFMD